jgi:DNA primase
LARVPTEIIRSVQEAVDIVDVVSRYVPLKRSGASFKGLCPFHEEKTPSFHVFQESQRFKCFGCGEGGDVFEFLMKHVNLGFRDAIEELAREVNIELPVVDDGPEEEERNRRRGAALRALEFAEAFYRAVFARPAGEAARVYLEGRGFDAETLEAFRIGFAPDDYRAFSGYARGKGHSEQALFDAGLVRRRESGDAYDMFRGRIMFPIRDARGQVIGFGARALGDDEPKYLNSPDGLLFHKGSELYGLDLAVPAARRSRRLLVVEGYTDVMQAHQSGIHEVVAGLGTALTPENARTLRRQRADVVLLYDGDEAGRRAAERAADVLLAEDVEGSVALLPPGQDPADLLRAEGPGAVEEAVSKAASFWEYRVRSVRERHDLADLEDRRRAIGDLLETVGRMQDQMRRDVAFKLLSEQLEVPERTIREFAAEKQRTRRVGAEQARPAADGVWEQAEREMIAAAILESAVWERLAEIHGPERFRDPVLRLIAESVGNLRRHGESLDYQTLRSHLADRDEAVHALGKMVGLTEEQSPEVIVARASAHLDRLERERRLQSAVESQSLEAVVRARKGTS